jgi:cell division septation protein DedD
MEIRNCIAELLSEHDCVIIPDFGGFIGNYCPSRIDPVHHSFHPPSKKILFNINLRHNDGLLATRVSTVLGISYSDACKVLEDFSEECIESLNAGESLHFSKVGRLFAGTEGNIQFEQHKTANLLPDSFGFTSFVSPPVTNQSSLRNIGNKTVIRPNNGHRRIVLPRLIRWAAVLALPIGIAVVIGVVQFDRVSSKYAFKPGVLHSIFSRFSSASLVEKKTVPIGKQTLAVSQAAMLPLKSEPEPVSTDQQQVKPAIPAQSRGEGFSTGRNFAVIIGAFRLEENAHKLIQELKDQGLEATVFDQSKSGLYRVAMGSFSKREEALQLLASIQSTRFKSAWLLVK